MKIGIGVGGDGTIDAMIKQVTDYAVNERGFEKKDIIHEKFFD